MVITRTGIKFLMYICLLCILVFPGWRMQGEVKQSVFGKMPDGTQIYIFTLQQGAVKARVMTYGARLVSLEGTLYHLPKIEGDNSLHGGAQGFDKRVWAAK